MSSAVSKVSGRGGWVVGARCVACAKNTGKLSVNAYKTAFLFKELKLSFLFCFINPLIVWKKDYYITVILDKSLRLR